MTRKIETKQEAIILNALGWMCVQYIGINNMDRDVYGPLFHCFMGAGEEAIEVLADYGLVEETGDGGVWTEAGIKFLEGDGSDYESK